MEILIHEDNNTCGESETTGLTTDFPNCQSCRKKCEELKMKGFFRSGKNLIFLFICGFLVGIFLEILLIERQKLHFLPQRDSLTDSDKVTCLVLQKHPHKRYIHSSISTWLQHCDEYFAVHVIKSQNPKKNIEKNSTTLSDIDEFQRLIENNKTCVKNEGEFKSGGKIVANSAWGGLCKALHTTKHGLKDWIIIVPDNLVVLVENLKHLVRNMNPNDDHYFGYALENYNGDFNTLSAGIVLSRSAVLKLFEKFKTEKDCDLSGKYWRNEDIYLGKYLKELGILPKDTRDEEGRGRFHGYNLKNLIWPGKLLLRSDYIKKALYPIPKGFMCCSPFLVTVDVTDADAMRNLYFFLYKVKTTHNQTQEKIQTRNEKKFYWKDFLREEGYNETAIENMTDEEYYKIWEKKLPLKTVYEETKKLLKNHQGPL